MRALLPLCLFACIAFGFRAQESRATIDEVLARTTYVETQRFRLTGGRATAVAFSPDDRLLAVGGECGDVLVFDVSDPKAPRRTAAFDAADMAIEQIAFAGVDDGWLVAKAGDVSIWSRDGDPVRRVPTQHGAVSPDGAWIAYVAHSDASVVRIERIDDGELVARWASSDERLAVAGFSDDGGGLIGSAGVGWLWTWAWQTDDPPTQGHLGRWPTLHGRMQGAAPRDFWARDPGVAVGRRSPLTATVEERGVVRLRLGAEELSTVGGLAEAAESLAFTGDGAHLVTGRREATVVFDGNGNRLALDRGGPVARGPMEHAFVQVVRGGLEVVDARTGRVTGAVAPPTDEPRVAQALGVGAELFASRRGDELLIGSARSGTWWVDVEAGAWQQLDEFEGPGDAFWSADGRVVLAVLESQGHGFPVLRTARIVRRDPGGVSAVPSVDPSDPVASAAFSDDGEVLYRGGATTLVATRPDASEPLATSATPVRWFRALDASLGISHDGHVVTLWDLRTLERLGTFSPPRVASTTGQVAALRDVFGPTPIRAAILSPDRRRLAIAGMRDVLVWELRRDG